MSNVKMPAVTKFCPKEHIMAVNIDNVPCKHCGKLFKRAGIRPHEKHCPTKTIKPARHFEEVRPNGGFANVIKQTVSRQSIRSDVPIDYVDCPHCSGVLVIGENHIDHINDLRTFLAAVARQLSAKMEPVSNLEIREQVELLGTEERTVGNELER